VLYKTKKRSRFGTHLLLGKGIDKKHKIRYCVLIMHWTKHITTDQKILCGKPIIKDTRISVEFIMELLASKMTPQNIVTEYPELTTNDIFAALQYATHMLKGEEIIAAP
jgi:uncharacterized protein (DUF433 family)